MRKRGLYYKFVESQEQSSSQIDCNDHYHQLNIDKNDDSNTNLPQLETGLVIQNSESINNHDKFEKEFKEPDISIWTLLRLNQPEWKYISFGIIGSVIMGLSVPIYGILYGEVFGLFDHSLQEDVYRLNNMYALVISI